MKSPRCHAELAESNGDVEAARAPTAADTAAIRNRTLRFMIRSVFRSAFSVRFFARSHEEHEEHEKCFRDLRALRDLRDISRYLQVKLFSSSGLPDPVYSAFCGYAHSGRVRVVSPPTIFLATRRDGA